MFLLTTLSLLLTSTPPGVAPSIGSEFPSMLYVRDEVGWEPVTGLDAIRDVPIPMQTTSEILPRAARTPQGIGIRIVASTQKDMKFDSLQLLAVRHPAGWRMVRVVDSDELRIVGPPRLPFSVTRPDDDRELLPLLARQDGTGVSGSFVVQLPADAAEGQTLELFLRELASGEVDALSLDGAGCIIGDKRRTFTLPVRPWESANGCPVTAKPRTYRYETPYAVDQLFLADSRVVDRASAIPLKLRSAHSGLGSLAGEVQRHGAGPYWPIIKIADDTSMHDELPELAARTNAKDGQHSVLEKGHILEAWFDSPPDAKDGETWSLAFRMERDTAGFPYNYDYGSPASRMPSSPARGLFRDVAAEAGIEMVHMEGPNEQLDIRPTMGPGAAWGDIDGDGWVDLFLPQGGGREGSRVPAAKMVRNKGDGTFEDVTKASNLALRGAGMGALFFDADGDGDLDLFVANYGPNKLLLNDGEGRFTDVTVACGVPQDDRWHAAVVASDYDRDGDLDLYITSYLRYDTSQMPPAEELGKYQREDPLEMLPFAFPAERNTFLRNDRVKSKPTDANSPRDPAHEGPVVPSFRFSDVTDELKVPDPNGRGMQAIFWDFDRDGDQDLYIANDVSPNTFFRNEGDGTFKDISLSTGLDDPRGSMGLSVGDIDGDGDEDLFVANWQLEANALYVNNLVTQSSKHRIATFRDQAVQAGLAQPSVGVTSWGCELADFDLDGDLDLFYANGYTSPDYESTGTCVGQPCHYFENDGTGNFTPQIAKAGPDAAIPLASRCALACDYDQDGDLDLVVTANNGRVRLLRNELARGRSWLGVRLRGKGGNTFAIGAEVTIKIGDKLLRRSLRAGTSYLGGNPPELHFGLGDAKKIDELGVRWPDRRETKHAIAKLDVFVTLHEPD